MAVAERDFAAQRHSESQRLQQAAELLAETAADADLGRLPDRAERLAEADAQTEQCKFTVRRKMKRAKTHSSACRKSGKG